MTATFFGIFKTLKMSAHYEQIFDVRLTVFPDAETEVDVMILIPGKT